MSFKDFGKEAKDLLTKNTAEGKAVKDGSTFPAPIWKVESKLKAKKGNAVVINPIGDQGSVSANVEFIVEQVAGLKGKLAVPSSNIKATKPTITFEQSGRKVEVAVKSFTDIAAYDVTLEDKQKSHAAAVQIVPGKISADLAAPVGNGVSLGFAAQVATSPFKLSSYSVGAKYNCCKNTNFSLVSTGAAASLAITAACEIPQVKLEGKPVLAGAVVSYDRVKSALKWTAGVSASVPACPCGSSFKAKIDQAFSVSLSHFVEICGWKIATTYDVKSASAGVVFTRE